MSCFLPSFRILSLLLLTVSVQACSESGGATPACPNGQILNVSAAPRQPAVDVLTPTSVDVKAGDVLTFVADGLWTVGLGFVGPEGRMDWCECPVSERARNGSKGPLGALIGRIGNGRPFLIGKTATVKASSSGRLFLGSNDNMGLCDGRTRGSCYHDNQGQISVCITNK